MPDLRLLTYNVRYFGHRTGGLTSQDSHVERVAGRIAGMDGGPPDILCLQEIETNSLRADIGRRQHHPNRGTRRTQFERFVSAFHQALATNEIDHQYRSMYFPAHRYRLGKRRNIYTTGLAVLVRDGLQIVRENTGTPHDITHRREGRLARLKQTRIAAHVRLVLEDGQQLDLFNTHLSLPNFFTRDLWTYTKKLGHGENQLNEVGRLLRYIDSVSKPENAKVICGDFNSLPGSPVHDLVTNRYGFRDAFRQLHAMDPPAADDYPTAGVLGLTMPLDYMFSSNNVEWLDFDTTHTFGLDSGHFHGLSDHVPLIARLRLPKTDGQVKKAA